MATTKGIWESGFKFSPPTISPSATLLPPLTPSRGWCSETGRFHRSPDILGSKQKFIVIMVGKGVQGPTFRSNIVSVPPVSDCNFLEFNFCPEDRGDLFLPKRRMSPKYMELQFRRPSSFVLTALITSDTNCFRRICRPLILKASHLNLKKEPSASFRNCIFVLSVD
jgi:hypothetical protein